jgi:3-oxoacyl-[acyl-carrier protein] reductase
MDLQLDGKVALVTGGSRGLGLAICAGLAAEGTNVAINYYHDTERGIDLVDEAIAAKTQLEEAHGIRAIAVPGDVSRSDDIVAMFDQCESELGPLDVLVNNAGLWPTAFVKDMTEEDWDQTVAVNLKGPFLTCREAVRRWLSSERTGRIVNVSTQAAFLGATTGHAHYAAAKAGLVNFTVSLAREVAPQGIYVNGVAPGMMRTEMAREALEKGEQEYLKRIPLRRVSDPSEVAAVVTFLASARASYTTGATFDATGGMLMR